MDEDQTDEEIWITQSSFSTTCTHKHVGELTKCEDQFSSVSETLVVLNKADDYEATRRVSDIDLAGRIEERIPKATRSSTNWAIGVWEKWARERNSSCVSCSQDKFGQVGSDIALLPNDELNYWLAKFVLEIRKKESGQAYCGNTLYQMVCGLQRFIRDNGRPELNFFEQGDFKLFRDSLDAEMKRLVSLGIGVLVKEAEPLTMDEEDILWGKNFLGRRNPRALLNSMVFLLGRCFALRGGKEHRGLTFKQLTLVEGENGAPAKLCYSSFGEKNNKGGLKDMKYKPKRIEHHANLANPTRCIVELYREYIARCPKDSFEGPFYLRPKDKYVSDVGATWYLKVPVGHNTLGSTVKRICKEAGITGNKTNHSLRATTATRGLELGIPDKMLMERTGHRSVESLHRYQRPSELQREMVSHALDNGKRPNEMVQVGGENLKRLCSENIYDAKDGDAVDVVGGRGNVITFERCTVNINNFN